MHHGGGSEETVVKNVAETIIKWISWSAIAIATGVMFFIGIKYVMSGANERADVKRMFPLYLLGLFIIVMAATIASFVAVNVGGNEGADDVIQVGLNAGDRFSGYSSVEGVDGPHYVAPVEYGSTTLEELNGGFDYDTPFDINNPPELPPLPQEWYEATYQPIPLSNYSPGDIVPLSTPDTNQAGEQFLYWEFQDSSGPGNVHRFCFSTDTTWNCIVPTPLEGHTIYVQPIYGTPSPGVMGYPPVGG